MDQASNHDGAWSGLHSRTPERLSLGTGQDSRTNRTLLAACIRATTMNYSEDSPDSRWGPSLKRASSRKRKNAKKRAIQHIGETFKESKDVEVSHDSCYKTSVIVFEKEKVVVDKKEKKRKEKKKEEKRKRKLQEKKRKEKKRKKPKAPERLKNRRNNTWY